MEDVFMAIGKPICSRFRHSADFSPNNPIPQDPTIGGRGRLYAAGNRSERLVMVCVTNVEEH
jgi:hypothetical protein